LNKNFLSCENHVLTICALWDTEEIFDIGHLQIVITHGEHGFEESI